VQNPIEWLKTALADRYTIQRELGSGGMATVYLAEDLKHHRKVAIKLLKPEFAAALGPERFLREIEIAAGLAHPHILPLYDSGETAGLLYYVMPYVAGKSLRDRLNREGPLPVADAVEIARSVASALAYAHHQDVVHRDIKPENILLESGHAVVSDFGIARAITTAGGARLTETGVAVGTPAYMSPEQAAGGRQLDGRTDIYSLGCVLYEMLAGEPPYTGPTAQSIVHQHLAAPPPRVTAMRSGIPPAIDHAIERALAKSPADRFPTAMRFAEALDTRAGPPLRRFPRSWLRTAVIAGLAVIVVTLGARWAWQRWPSIGSGMPVGDGLAPNSVAVLYFDNLSRDTADAYLADGLTEEITARLGQIARLVVKSRNAVRRYRGVAIDPPTAGRTLGVAHLVSGSIRRAGRRLRVTVELVRAGSGDRLWGEQYDRTDADVLVIEEDVARAVATAIAGRLFPAERASLAARPTQSPVAYDHYLHGNYYLAQRSGRVVRLAIEAFEAAVRADSGFTAAVSRIGYAYAIAAGWEMDVGGLALDTILARGLAAVNRALRLDSASADAWLSRGYLLSHQHPWTLDGVRPSVQRALTLDPRSAEGHHVLAWYHFLLGHDSAAIAEYRRTLAIEPERPVTYWCLGLIAYRARRYAEVRRLADSVLVLDPRFAVALALRASAEAHLGEFASAGADADEALRLADPGLPAAAAEIARALVDRLRGDTTAVRGRVEHLRTDPAWARPFTARVLALSALYGFVGEPQRGVAVLAEVRHRPRGLSLWSFVDTPDRDPLRTLPSFQRLLDEIRPRETAP
jgi:serine/threonine-protein kinase